METGAWAPLDIENEGGEKRRAEQGERFAERDFDFPVVLLDVDDTVPKFKSVMDVNGATLADWDSDIYD